MDKVEESDTWTWTRLWVGFDIHTNIRAVLGKVEARRAVGHARETGTLQRGHHCARSAMTYLWHDDDDDDSL